MMERLVLDTNVIVAALLSADGGSRVVLRLCLRRRYTALIGDKLFSEYEDVFGRPEMLERSPLGPEERVELFDAFLSVCEWTPIFFLWRPNLPDEADNHLVELAVAGGATSLVTHNVKDFRRGELRFPSVRIETPKDFLKRWRITHGYHDD